QAARGGLLFKLAACRVLSAATERRIKHNQGEWALAIPDAAARGGDSAFDRCTVKYYLRLAPRSVRVALYILRGVGNETRQRRIICRLTPTRRSHERLPHAILHSQGGWTAHVNVIYPYAPSYSGCNRKAAARNPGEARPDAA